jgi:hypothetical protein
MNSLYSIFEQDYTDLRIDRIDTQLVFNPVNLLIRVILFKFCWQTGQKICLLID